MSGDSVSQARRTAGEAARQAGVVVADLEAIDDLRALSHLFDRIWQRPVPMVGVDLLRALVHAGNQVSGAYPVAGGGGGAPEVGATGHLTEGDGGRVTDEGPVGGTVAFLGRHPPGAGEGAVHLHSHITGVDGTGRGVGFALKQHQRHWALARGIDEVRWTFDPLVRRNAVFNLIKLGARVVAYAENLYGAVDDAINAGEPTDRAIVAWPLASGRAVACSEGRFHEPDVAALRRAGAVVLLDEDAAGDPVLDEGASGRLGEGGPRHVLVRVPADIEGMRPEHPARAADWQAALRRTLAPALGAGYRTSGFTRDGFYVLALGGAVAELAG